jgi:hypothetical protein
MKSASAVLAGQNVDGKRFVSPCGAERGGVYLAPLTWKDQFLHYTNMGMIISTV